MAAHFNLALTLWCLYGLFAIRFLQKVVGEEEGVAVKKKLLSLPGSAKFGIWDNIKKNVYTVFKGTNGSLRFGTQLR